MASGDKFYIADKATLDEVNAKVGVSEDVGGAEGVGSLHAKENTLLRQTKQILDHLKGEYLNNFGDGRMGDFVYGTTPDSPMIDEYGRRVYYTENFTIPSGKTMKVTSKNNGMVIWARGDITIDGTLDISEMRNTSADPVGLPSSVDIAGTNFVFATGGSSGSFISASRPCGSTGKITAQNGTVIADANTDDGLHDSNQNSKANSVSGGALSLVKYYPWGPYIGYSSGLNRWTLMNDYGYTSNYFKGHIGAGAVILICAGTIKITGTIKANGVIASFEPNGSAPVNEGSTHDKRAGRGGEVLAYQGGGGAVTLIAKTINNAGTINVSGNASKAVAAGRDNVETLPIALQEPLYSGTTLLNHRDLIFTGGKGANGYTCSASSSGNIKQYILK